MATEFKDSSISSVLKLTHIVFDEIHFKRIGFSTMGHNEAQIGIAAHKEKTGDGKYQVSLSLRAIKKREYEAVVTITGYCEIDENTPYKDKILSENTVAILFPYVRAQMTLLTAQPETEPLVIPAVNVNALIKQAEESNET
ncbi:protein-export chaperone SecB [Oscillospiraceae bacterium 44-34]|jgi:preprotein translocase subunit SecB